MSDETLENPHEPYTEQWHARQFEIRATMGGLTHGYRNNVIDKMNTTPSKRTRTPGQTKEQWVEKWERNYRPPAHNGEGRQAQCNNTLRYGPKG